MANVTVDFHGGPHDEERVVINAERPPGEYVFPDGARYARTGGAHNVGEQPWTYSYSHEPIDGGQPSEST